MSSGIKPLPVVAAGSRGKFPGPDLLVQPARARGPAATDLSGRTETPTLDELYRHHAAKVSRLAQEAARLRIDALLLSRQSGKALGRLNALALSEGVRDLELRLIRGELRAAANDCARARMDFASVLSQSADASLRRRATAGRVGCDVRDASAGDGPAGAHTARALGRPPSTR